MKPTISAVVLVMALLVATSAISGLFSSVSANPDGEALQLSMPIEHINYTITTINGSLWAKIDGNYPISFQNPSDCTVLPMVYPMPPNSTNIHIYLGEQELTWSNYTQAFPEYLHKTAIGDWWMISSVLENLSDSFVLRIHYEHPVERVNGSYGFLYDLNIVDYLSPQSPDSTAYFTVGFEGNFSGVGVYTAPVDSVISEWQPKAFSSTAEGITVEMHSQYGVALPGDLVVVFSDGADSDGLNTISQQQDDSVLSWVIPVMIDVILIAILLYVKRKALLSTFSSRKTAT